MKAPSKIICGTSIALLLIAFLAFKLYASSPDAQLSAVVALVSKGPSVEKFLEAPGTSFIEANFYIPDGLAEDVIFGVDQELIEGVDRPLYIKGGDWMGLVGLQRSGNVWIAAGTHETMQGKPSQDRAWKIESLGQPLKPNTWYQIRCESDFGKRSFKSMQVKGPGLNKSLTLDHFKLDYPNYMPFDARSMSYYVFAMRGRSMMKTRGTPLVYFDDVKGGVESNGKSTVIFQSSFEDQAVAETQPVTLPVIKLAKYRQNHFYLEREESKFRIERAPFALSGKCVGVADVDLQ